MKSSKLEKFIMSHPYTRRRLELRDQPIMIAAAEAIARCRTQMLEHLPEQPPLQVCQKALLEVESLFRPFTKEEKRDLGTLVSEELDGDAVPIPGKRRRIEGEQRLHTQATQFKLLIDGDEKMLQTRDVVPALGSCDELKAMIRSLQRQVTTLNRRVMHIEEILVGKQSTI